MPPTVPINHYDGPRNQQNRTKRPILLFHANIFEQYACFEHSNFFKVNDLDPEPTKLMADPFSRKMANVRRHTQA